VPVDTSLAIGSRRLGAVLGSLVFALVAPKGALAAKAPHPHAALLYLDYLFSDGQQVLEENFYSTGATQVPFASWMPEQGKTAAQIEDDATQWNSLFNSLFRSR
jgi:iron(III) transport system substrate-binding protein